MNNRDGHCQAGRILSQSHTQGQKVPWPVKSREGNGEGSPANRQVGEPPSAILPTVGSPGQASGLGFICSH